MDVIPGREVRIPCGDLSLEGLLHVPDGDGPFRGIVVCHPHPQYGGDMYNNVVGALVRASLASGLAALRFNFRGVGESDGVSTGGSAETEDVRAAFAFLKDQPEIDAEHVSLAGYSFGAMMALLTAESLSPDALALISVPTIGFDLQAPGGDFPLLVVTGDRDSYVDVATLTAAMGGRGTVEVLEGVDHFWWGSDSRLVEIVGGFLATSVARA